MASAAAIVLVVVIVAAGVFNPSVGSGQGDEAVAGDPFAARTPDPGAPAFPVPPEAELVNAYAEGNEAAAYRIALWTSSMPVDEVVSFYTDLQDQRWSLAGSPLTVIGVARFTFSDGQGTYDHAAVDVSPGTVTRIAVRFVPRGSVAAPTADTGSLGASPSSAIGSPSATLPPSQDLPAGFPDWAKPPGGSLVDAGELNGLLLAVFELNGTEADARDALLGKLQDAGLSATVTSINDGEVLDVSAGHGQIIVEATTSGVQVSVAVRP